MTDDIKVEAPGTADKAKLTVAVLIVVGGRGGLLPARGAAHLAALDLRWSSAWCWREWWSRSRATAPSSAAFVELSRIELRKIVWPSRNETGMTTLVVFVFVIAAGLFFWAVDWVLALGDANF